MASPESVSAIFPMEAGLFDLVIFDEASQCYAEYGLPAAFRGKQLVVTGDKKQLSPSDLYKVRFEERRMKMSIQRHWKSNHYWIFRHNRWIGTSLQGIIEAYPGSDRFLKSTFLQKYLTTSS